MALKTDYKDDILDVSQNTKRKYTMIENQDGTVSFDDETVYSQEGDSFGASDINAITEAVNSNSGMPVGTIATFDGTTLPSGFEPYQTEEQRAIAQINDNLTASNDTPFRFGYDSNSGEYGYIINEGGADTLHPFSTTIKLKLSSENSSAASILRISKSDYPNLKKVTYTYQYATTSDRVDLYWTGGQEQRRKTTTGIYTDSVDIANYPNLATIMFVAYGTTNRILNIKIE